MSSKEPSGSNMYFEITQKLLKYLSDLYNAPTLVLKQLYADNFIKSLETIKINWTEYGPRHLNSPDIDDLRPQPFEDMKFENYLNGIKNVNYNGDPNLLNDYSRAVMRLDDYIVYTLYRNFISW